jgi:tetratricopeptide (TPR) repeat protein
MKRAAILVAVLVGVLIAAPWASAQATTQTPPAPGAQGTAPAPPAGKRPPQAKTQPEFEGWKAASTGTDPAVLEKAADDFATKFPDSELRVLLYKNVMRAYQAKNAAEKTEAMGRKVLALDGDDPEALFTVAEVIAERTRDTDLDKDQRYAEATQMAQKATQTVDTDLAVPAGTPQDKLDAAKALLRSQAYSVIGTIEYKKENYAGAESDLQKSIDAYPSEPDSVVVLRLALALDKQGKYPEALKVANRAVELTKEGDTVGTYARRERDRLVQLTGGAAPKPAAQPQAPAPKN